MRRIIAGTLSGLKYLIALVMMLEGIETMLSSPQGDPRLGFLYSHRYVMLPLGFIFFASGTALMYGKIRRKRKVIGYALLAIYLSFLFGFIVQLYGYGFDEAWPNGVAFLITGGLYLRWKYHILYVEKPKFSLAEVDTAERTV